jgi:hypothetical protein
MVRLAEKYRQDEENYYRFAHLGWFDSRATMCGSRFSSETNLGWKFLLGHFSTFLVV